MKTSSSIPVVRNVPLVGFIPTPNPLRKLAEYSAIVRKYGDVARIEYPRRPTYIVADPELAGQILVRDADKTRKDIVARTRLSRVLGDSVLVSDGAPWAERRKALQPAFRPKLLSSYADVAVAQSARLCERLRRTPDIDVHSTIAELTLNILTQSIFGMQLTSEQHAIIASCLDDLMAINHLYGMLLPVLSNGRMRRIRARFHRVVSEIIEYKRRHPGEDLLSALLVPPEGAAALSDEAIRDEVVTLLLAGHETTALTITYATWLLGLHPHIRQQLHAELDERIPNGLTSHTTELPLTDAILQEALRLLPPVWSIGREVVEPLALRNEVIQPGAHVMIYSWGLHRDPRFWREAEHFRPERWLNGEIEAVPRHVYLPFGAGPRICIGKLFAQMEARVVLATLWQQFAAYPDRERELRVAARITLRPDGPVRMRFVPRTRNAQSRAA